MIHRSRSTFAQHVVAYGLTLLLVAGCTAGGDAGETAAAGASDPSLSASAEESGGPVDLAAEAGKHNPAGAFVDAPEDFEEQPPPPDSDVRMLCDLNSTYVSGLADLASGDGEMSMSDIALSLNDSIQVWESLVGHYPEVRGDVEQAKRILNLWHQAMAHEEAGDAAAAEKLRDEADEAIRALSDSAFAEDAHCSTS